MAERVKVWFSRIKNWTVPSLGYFKTAAPVDTPEAHLTKALGKYESYVFKIQSILKWEDPLISVLCILAANFIFWFMVSFECRFYGLLFSSILACFVYDMWVDQIWPEISIPVAKKMETEEWTPQHPSGVLSVPEISHYISQTNCFLKDSYIYMKTLRTEHPAVFCCEMCVILGLLAVVGRTVPGAVISYCILMSILIGPGLVIHVLPRSTVDGLTNIVSSLRLRHKEGDSEVDELLPDGSDANMALFQEALDGEHSDRDDTNEFCLDAESSGLTSAATRGDGSLDTLDEFDLSPRAEPPGPPAATDSDSDGDPGIHFRSSHFNGDSSEDDDEVMEMTRGLDFPDPGDKTGARQQARQEAAMGSALLTGLASNLSSYVGAMGTSLISTVISRAAVEAATSTTRVRRKSSTDSNEEFEIITKEDVS